MAVTKTPVEDGYSQGETATYTVDPTTGEYTATPGTSTLTVTGTI